jgi:hypothetical protein
MSFEGESEIHTGVKYSDVVKRFEGYFSWD